MAASANQPVQDEEDASTKQLQSSSSKKSTTNNGGARTRPKPENSKTAAALKHNPGLAVDWDPDEQSILDDLLVKLASDSNIVRYAKISRELKDKTVRDVALRCRWMSKKENGKRRKEDHSSGRKNKDRKEKAMDSTAKASTLITARSNGQAYTPPMISMDDDDDISYKAIGGVTGELLEQNAQMFNQISTNFASFQAHENINLLCRARDNILSILNDMNDLPEVMKSMPPLPIKINEELVKSVLPRPSQQ